MEVTTQSLLLYTVLQVCAVIGITLRALPGKEEQTHSYQAKGNIGAILLLSFIGYLLFLFW